MHARAKGPRSTDDETRLRGRRLVALLAEADDADDETDDTQNWDDDDCDEKPSGHADGGGDTPLIAFVKSSMDVGRSVLPVT